MGNIYVNGIQIHTKRALKRHAHYPCLQVRVTGVKNPVTVKIDGASLVWYAQKMGVFG